MNDLISQNIVYISPYYRPDVASGANRRFDEICQRFLRDYGDNFTLIVSRGCKPRWWQGSNLIEVDYKFNHWTKWKAMRQIARVLNTLPPSTVIMESVPIPFRALKRHVHFQVAYDFRYFTGASKGFLYRLFFSRYLKRQWARSQYIVTCSEFSISELQKYVGYDRSRVLKSYFGIDGRLLNQESVSAPSKTIDIIYVGHFEKRKNHAPLLHAIAKVDPHLRVMLVGVDNGLKASLQILATDLGLDHVTFTTIHDDVKLWQLYRESRVFAYPSVYEGFGIPLIEALVLGTPVVCSDIDVFREIGGNVVTFFDPNNPDDIAQKLAVCLLNGKPADRGAVEKHLEQFTWDHIYAAFVRDLNLFAEKAKEHSGR